MQIKGSLLIGVLTCQAYQDRANTVRQTWGRQAEAIVYAVGRPGQPSELAGDTLYLDCPDGYADLPRKTLAFFRFVRDRFDFDHVFKCDDDTLLNVPALEALPKRHDYMGFVTGYENPPGPRVWRGVSFDGPWRGPWACGGVGYLVSRKAVKILADCQDRELTDGEVFEDKMVADILRAAHITPGFLPGPPGLSAVKNVLAGVAVSAHPVNTKILRRAYAKMVKKPIPVLSGNHLMRHGPLRSGLRWLASSLGLPGPLAERSKPTLTFHGLGQHGRLGNQLWQIAGTLGLAAHYGLDVSFNADWGSRDVFQVPDEFFVARRGIHAPHLLVQCPPQQRVYMQDYLLWWPIAEQICRYFRPRAEFLRQLQQRNPWFFAIPVEARLSVHVRRGDYAGIYRHNYAQLGLDYYRTAMACFPGMTPIFFADDDTWCREQFPGSVVAPPVKRPEDHLILMTLCKNHIIANSTFSWWGAMLANDPAPLYPKPWYGPGLAQLQVEWMIPPGWTCIKAG
jgi:hypothetical protein